ncbi:hypothetical protein LUZ60_014289 [Juncus effusus]|nr:hypothetical protein LUZ60_014289 [Juncus effusus]
MEAMALSFSPVRTLTVLSIKSSVSSETLVKPHASSISTLSVAPSDSGAKPFKIARKDAIDGVRTSMDLESALHRAEGLLQVEDYNIILRYFGESKKWSQVNQLFEWMQKHDAFNFASYSSYFKYMGLSRDPIKALKVYDCIKDEDIKQNVSVCNSVLGCLVRNGRSETALKLFDQMKSNCLKPDLVTYSTLLTGCSKLKDGYEKAMEILKELKNSNLGMDIVIYGTLLSICASNNLIQEAELYFEEMKNEGHRPNLFHYSSLLNVYANDRNYTKADVLIKDMKSQGIPPNKVILTTLLKVYARGGLFEKSKELLSELETLGYAKDEIPYAILMDNLAKQDKIWEAQILFNEMNEKGIKSDGYAYSIMISAFCRKGLVQEAKKLAKEFEAKYAKYDNVVILNTLLRAYCNNGDMESVMQMLRKMDETNISPDWNTFHILIKFFSRQKLYPLVYKTIEDMNSKGHQLNEELCTRMIIQLGKNGFASEAFSVYNMLRYSKRNISKSLHEIVLNILVSAGLLKDAYLIMKDFSELISDRSMEKFLNSFIKSGNINLINDVLKAYHRSKKKINPEIFSKAITRYMEKKEKKELLLHLLQWMTGQAYSLDATTRNLLLKNAHIFGNKQIIAEILSKQQVALRKSKLKTEARKQVNK